MSAWEKRGTGDKNALNPTNIWVLSSVGRIRSVFSPGSFLCSGQGIFFPIDDTRIDALILKGFPFVSVEAVLKHCLFANDLKREIN